MISDQFNHPKSIKQPKTLFLAHFAILFCVNAYSNLTFIILMKISTSISFLSITISNISHMETAKVRRMTKNFIFGSLNHSKNAFLQCLNDPSCTGNSAGCYKTLSAITICIIKSIQETKLQILAKILLFGT